MYRVILHVNEEHFNVAYYVLHVRTVKPVHCGHHNYKQATLYNTAMLMGPHSLSTACIGPMLAGHCL